MSDWIENPGKQPDWIPEGALVEVKLLNGTDTKARPANEYAWGMENGSGFCITHYRILEKIKDDDIGKHYRHEYRGIKFDPYRVCWLYGIKGGPREHIVKKALRGTDKGHTELELINELQACLDRWREMVEEDSA